MVRGTDRLRTLVLSGAGVVILYMAASTLTMESRGAGIRPLFEGFSPGLPYEWVTPPALFAAGNVVPARSYHHAPVAKGATLSTQVSADNAQVLLALPSRAIAVGKGTSGVVITTTPLDPARLGAVPSGLAADGNAYRIVISEQPSQKQVTTLARRGSLVVTVPQAADDLLFSADGVGWVAISSIPIFGTLSIGAEVSHAGYYLPACLKKPGPLRAVAGPGATSSGGFHPVLVAAIAVVIVLAIGLLYAARMRKRSRRGASAPGSEPDDRAEQLGG